jgi:hypothetical protein
MLKFGGISILETFTKLLVAFHLGTTHQTLPPSFDEDST